MAHQHDHGNVSYNWAFAVGTALNVVFVLIEAAYGFVAGSLALLADAGHNLSDVIGLLLAWGASHLAQKKPTALRTYGFRRATILAALLSALLVLVAVGAIVWDAVRRFSEPVEVNELTVIIVAGIGVIINTLTALLFWAGRKKDLNVRGAFLHMAADAGVSLGVVIAGVLIMITQWLLLDPIISLLIAVVIFWSTWDLLSESLNLALDAVPKDVNPEELLQYLSQLPDVEDVHDLHVWALSTTETALTVHLVMPQGCGDEFLSTVTEELRQRFGIVHVTIQIEPRLDYPCHQAAPEHV